MADVLVLQLAFEARTVPRRPSDRHANRMHARPALHLVSTVEVWIGVVPIERCEQGMIVVSPIVVGCVAVADLREIACHCKSKVARQVLADVGAAICQAGWELACLFV